MAKIFTGYIPSINKMPIEKIKGVPHLTEPPTDSDYVGVLRQDIIQLDFDNQEIANKVLKVVTDLKLKCDILKTTRGLHFFFINDSSFVTSQSVGIFNALGLPCDIGLGSKDRVVPLRTTRDVVSTRIINGEELQVVQKVTYDREWIQTYDDLDVLPCFLRPISKHDLQLLNCVGRNQTLFSYILKLQYKNFNTEEIRQTIKLVNKYIFESALSDKEIDTITRDNAFTKEIFYNEDGGFMHDRFGDYMLTNCNIIMLDGQPAIYTDDNVYSSEPTEFEKIMISKISNLKDTQRKEVFKYICLKCKRAGKVADAKYIGLKDSILDIETMSEVPYTPNYVMNNKLNYKYNENAYSEAMDRTLDKICCNDKDIRSLLEEMIGYTLYRKNSMQVCFILTGGGSNGKSTILNCIKNLVGKRNYTSLDLRELEENYKPAELHNKLANIGDDISAKYLESSSVFKKCVTGESFMVRRIYGTPFELESYATQIFCANEMPSVNDKTDGFGRRIVLIPFNAKFSNKDADFDPFIDSKLNNDEAIEYLLRLAIDGLKRILINQKFTHSVAVETEKQDYLRSNNNILEYFDDVDPKLEHESINEAYLAYSVWCSRTGCHAQKKLNFSKEVRKAYNLESKPMYSDGKTIRVYEKV